MGRSGQSISGVLVVIILLLVMVGGLSTLQGSLDLFTGRGEQTGEDFDRMTDVPGETPRCDETGGTCTSGSACTGSGGSSIDATCDYSDTGDVCCSVDPAVAGEGITISWEQTPSPTFPSYRKNEEITMSALLERRVDDSGTATLALQHRTGAGWQTFAEKECFDGRTTACTLDGSINTQDLYFERDRKAYFRGWTDAGDTDVTTTETVTVDTGGFR